MRLQIFDNHETLSRATADILLRTVRENPRSSIIIATGSTPTLAYQLWVQDLLRQDIPTDELMIIKLDEWGGLPMDHPSTCETYIQKHIIQPLSLRPDQVISFTSVAADPAAECDRVYRAISALPSIDCCVLGIGKNGHLGFNEPNTTWSTVPHVAKLSITSLGHAMLQGDSRDVQYGLTLGLDTISIAKSILALASGSEKTAIVEQALRGPVTPQCPASILQTLPQSIVYLDTKAAERITS